MAVEGAPSCVVALIAPRAFFCPPVHSSVSLSPLSLLFISRACCARAEKRSRRLDPVEVSRISRHRGREKGGLSTPSLGEMPRCFLSNLASGDEKLHDLVDKTHHRFSSLSLSLSLSQHKKTAASSSTSIPTTATPTSAGPRATTPAPLTTRLPLRSTSLPPLRPEGTRPGGGWAAPPTS